MKARALPLLTLIFTLALAVPAFAHDNGEGLVGETNDRIITFFSLGRRDLLLPGRVLRLLGPGPAREAQGRPQGCGPQVHRIGW